MRKGLLIFGYLIFTTTTHVAYSYEKEGLSNLEITNKVSNEEKSWSLDLSHQHSMYIEPSVTLENKTKNIDSSPTQRNIYLGNQAEFQFAFFDLMLSGRGSLTNSNSEQNIGISVQNPVLNTALKLTSKYEDKETENTITIEMNKNIFKLLNTKIELEYKIETHNINQALLGLNFRTFSSVECKLEIDHKFIESNQEVLMSAVLSI